jgi:hypothetical protein
MSPESLKTLDQLKSNMDKTEAAIRALPTDAWVIVWGGSVLRTDGAKMGLLGPKIWVGNDQADAEAHAERFRATIAREASRLDEVVAAVMACHAHAIVREQNENLLATIESAMTR